MRCPASNYIRIAHWIAIADWYQTVLFHKLPQVAAGEMIGDMPCTLDIWNTATNDGFTALIPRLRSMVRSSSARDAMHGLMHDPPWASQAASAGRALSMFELMIILFGK